MCKLPFSRQWYLICRLTPKSQQVTVTVCWCSFKILNGKRRQKLKVNRLYISLQCRRLVGASYRYKLTIVYLRWRPGKSENLYCPTRPMFWPSFTPKDNFNSLPFFPCTRSHTHSPNLRHINEPLVLLHEEKSNHSLPSAKQCGYYKSTIRSGAVQLQCLSLCSKLQAGKKRINE